MKKIIIFILLLVLVNGEKYAQACCSSGTPLLGSLEMSSGSSGVLQLGLTYDYNSLQSVYEGSRFLNDQTRERLTQSALFEITYGLSNRWAITGLFSFVNQNRTINSFNNQTNEVSTNGLGDAVFLLKYKLVQPNIINQTELAVGGGLKVPTGKADIKNNGILLPADLQSGSGSYDVLFWAYYSKGFIPDSPISILANVSYKINSSYDRFGGNVQAYKFGNELILSSGLGYRTDTLFDFSLLVRFRNTAMDVFNDQNIPNTGGSWLYVIPGVNLKFTDHFTGRLSSQLPVYRDLQGTQLTTTYTISFSLFYSVSLSNSF
ncbi:MAG: transporter [Melioribacteraceae bacterium]|nr:transporter [Melioribacteraceae bacterium]